MAQRVTIQDIADELGVSRNTVSKAINNTGVLADATRDKILKKAMEMGYKQFSYMAPAAAPSEETAIKGPTEIALLTTQFLGNSHFASTTLDKFQKELSTQGYCLTMHRVLPDELKALQLPSSFDLSRVAGIVGVELFDYDYCKMLCDLDMPTLFIDSPVTGMQEPLKADCLYMNNIEHSYAFVQEMIRRGKTEIGFVGDYKHCQSFFERYIAYRNSLFLSSLPAMDHYCILGSEASSTDEHMEYKQYLRHSLQTMSPLPQVFVCANDFIAVDVLNILKDMELRVPEDICLCGFDDSPESKLVTPRLTTIHIHTQIMGYSATQLLISRIRQPSMNYRTVYAETDLIYRESTGD